MSLVEKVRTAQLPVTMRHEAFLAKGDPRYSSEAVLFASAQLRRDVGGQRKGRERKWRASGIGSCMRKRMFERMGVKHSNTPSTKSQNVFNNGNFAHLRWQMAGLTEGWLLEAEVPADTPLLGTTMDGIIWDGSILEFKSINTRGYRQVREYGVDYKHASQVHAMFLASGKRSASVIYEDKNDQEWSEYRVEYDQAIADDVQREIDLLEDGWQRHSLPPELPKCIDKDGMEWRNCAFRDICPLMTSWAKAAKAAA